MRLLLQICYLAAVDIDQCCCAGFPRVDPPHHGPVLGQVRRQPILNTLFGITVLTGLEVAEECLGFSILQLDLQNVADARHNAIELARHFSSVRSSASTLLES